MKKLKKVFVLLVFFLLGLFIIFPETLEEQYLKQKQAKIKTYFFNAKMGDRVQKADVLDTIISEFEEAKYTSKDKDLESLAEFLSEEGTTRREYENNMLINDFPEVRRKAAALLGKIGGDQARSALINILATDKNQAVQAEACIALSKVKDNDNGEALRALVFAYHATYRPDGNLVLAIIDAIRQIAKESSTSYADGIYILSEIQMGNYNRKVREAAYDAIQELGGVKKK